MEDLDFDFGLHCCIYVSIEIHRKFKTKIASLIGEFVSSLVYFIFEALHYFKACACFLFAGTMVIISDTVFLY